VDGIEISKEAHKILSPNIEMAISSAPKGSARYCRENEELEFDLLKQFFTQWERLHNFKGARELQMQCAQDLVETAHNIRNLRKQDGA